MTQVSIHHHATGAEIMSNRHLILGKTVDVITGETLLDTHDERLRQKIATLLIQHKGYQKNEITCRHKIDLHIDGKKGAAQVDFVVTLSDKIIGIVRYGPGSVVTRERSTIAAARILTSYEIPFSVITNGYDAAIMETSSTKVIGRGFDAICPRIEAEKKISILTFRRLSTAALDKEKRILFALEVLTEKECNDFKCESLF